MKCPNPWTPSSEGEEIIPLLINSRARRNSRVSKTDHRRMSAETNMTLRPMRLARRFCRMRDRFMAGLQAGGAIVCQRRCARLDHLRRAVQRADAHKRSPTNLERAITYSVYGSGPLLLLLILMLGRQPPLSLPKRCCRTPRQLRRPE